MKKNYLLFLLTFIFISLNGCSVTDKPKSTIKLETNIIEVKQEENQDEFVKQNLIVRQEVEENDVKQKAEVKKETVVEQNNDIKQKSEADQEIKEPEKVKSTPALEEQEKQEETLTEEITEEIIEKQPEVDSGEQFIENKVIIASGETDFNPNETSRSSNIRLAASYINGLVLYPGDEFSFNNVVGKRTKEKGFLPADVIVGGTYTKGYGGGVCQTSSTLCIAVRKTQMKILEQNPHSKRVTYTTIENEAMINYGTSDFRFVNTYDKPIELEFSFIPSGNREIIKANIYLLE